MMTTEITYRCQIGAFQTRLTSSNEFLPSEDKSMRNIGHCSKQVDPVQMISHITYKARPYEVVDD